mgnify:CR=1 FL=1
MRDKDRREYVEGHVVVCFERTVAEEDAKKLVGSFGLEVVDSISHIFLVAVPVGEENKWAEEFKKSELVTTASLETIDHLID